MALDTGKEKVKIQTLDSNVPYVKAKSNFSVAVDAFAPTFKRMQDEHAATAQANYFQNFQIQTRDYFASLIKDDKTRNDPSLMKQAVDTYSKELLDKVPPAYKIQANAMLSGASANLISHASNNRMTLDEQKFEFDNAQVWQTNKENAEFAIKTASEIPELNLSLQGINDKTIKALLAVNEQAHSDYELLVKIGSKETRSDKDHMKNINGAIEDLHVARGFYMMTAYGDDDKKALEWLASYNSGDNPTALLDQFTSEEHKDNPIFKMYQSQYSDQETRNGIKDKILARYKEFRNESIYGKPKRIKPNIKQLKEVGQPLHISNFIGGFTDVNKIAADNNLELTDELINYVSKANNTQRVVSKTMQNPNKIINWADEGVTPEEWATALLANNNINKVKYSDLQSDGFKTAINLMAEQDYYPPQLANALAINNGGSWKDESSLNKFAEQSEIYQYVKNLFPNIEYPGFYEQALSTGAIDEIKNGNFGTATNILEGINNDDKATRLTSIVNNEDSTLNFRQLFNSKVASPNWFMEMMAGGKGDLNKHLFTAADQSTFFAMVPSNITPPAAYTQFQNFFNEALANMTVGTEIDPWKDGNENLRNQAWNIATRKLKQSGWGIETNTSDGKPKLVKDPFWQTYGEPNNNDIYAHVKKAFMTGNNIEDTFGTKDWNSIHETLNKYFDNKNNENVKISIDRQMYNDENDRPAYKLTLWDGDFMIPIEGNFKPIGWTDLSKNGETVKGSMATLINDTTNKIYEEMGDKVWFNGEEHERSDWGKRFLHTVIRNGIKLSDYRFYPDIPGIDDQPKEIRPFAFLARMMGFNGDLREIATELSLAAKTANDSISQQKKINANRDLSNLEKVTSAAVPPEKMVLSENAMSLNFKDYALENYNNTELRLSHRTNNWTSISSDSWDGEIPLKYRKDGRTFAVFSHPKDSIRAAAKLFLNHSVLTQSLNKIAPEYGSVPTVEEILVGTKYATDMQSYFDALDDHPTLNRDTKIDLMDANQMHTLLKFITKHEMGVEYFNEKFGINNAYVNAVIFRGIDEAINSYNGELGKL